MSKNKSSVSINNIQIRYIVLLGVVVFLLFGWIWLRFVYTSPTNVFWKMVDDNLSTHSVTRSSSQKSQEESLEQITELHLGSQNASYSTITMRQKSESGQDEVKTENIGTPNHDYSRYTKIETSQKNESNQSLDFSKILGAWGKSADQKDGEKSQVQYFNQAVFGIVPFANLSREQRDKMISLIKDKNVYSPQYDSVKSQKIDGKQAYVYTVSLAPKAYIEMLQQLAKETGVGNSEDLSPEQYSGSPPIKLTITIGKLSHKLLKIKMEGSDNEESFSAHGLEKSISLPVSTIPINELQDRIQNIR